MLYIDAEDSVESLPGSRVGGPLPRPSPGHGGEAVAAHPRYARRGERGLRPGPSQTHSGKDGAPPRRLRTMNYPATRLCGVQLGSDEFGYRGQPFLRKTRRTLSTAVRPPSPHPTRPGCDCGEGYLRSYPDGSPERIRRLLPNAWDTPLTTEPFQPRDSKRSRSNRRPTL
jgi:hypothetical protein